MNSINLTTSLKRIACVMSFLPVAAFAQPTENIPDVQELAKIPPSPEAAAFVQYGNTPVSLYTGTPNISIPIHTIKGREIQIPISLTYDASGIKVEQVATWVGLGWNLNLGGMVTRNVIGKPDDYEVNYPAYLPYYAELEYNSNENFRTVKEQFEYFTQNNMGPLAYHDVSSGWLDDYLNFMEETEDGRIETMKDTYSFHVNGVSGTLIIDYNTGTAVCLEHPEFKVIPQLSDGDPGNIKILWWTIIDQYGTVYEFKQIELTQVEAPDFQGPRKYASAWSITRIISQSKKDEVIYEYSSSQEYENPQPVGGGYWRRDRVSSNLPNQCPSNEVIDTGIQYKIAQSYLEKVKLNGQVVVDLWREPFDERLDLAGKYKLDYIRIFNEENNLIVNTRLYNDSYFHSSTPTSTSEFDHRLKLDKVVIDEVSPHPSPQTYTFDYYGPTLPSRQSYAQDYWGYYNGQDGNPNMVPPMPGTLDVENNFQPGNREVSIEHAVTGTLKSITYPTGGTTEFHYSFPFTYNSEPETVEVNVFDSQSFTGGEGDDPVLPQENCLSEYIVTPNRSIFAFAITEPAEYIVKFSYSGTLHPTNPFTIMGIDEYPEYPDPINICEVENSYPMIMKENAVSLQQRMDNPQEFSPIVETVTLTPGWYYAALADNGNMSLSIKIYKEEETETYAQEFHGGLRLSHVVDKPSSEDVASTTYYYYGDLSGVAPETITEAFLESNSASDGILHKKALFTKLYESNYFTEMYGIIVCDFIDRYSSPLNTGGKNLYTHNIVTEIKMDPDQNYNGMTVYEFYNDLEVSTTPYVAFNPLNGLIKSKSIYKKVENGHELQLREENNYTIDYEQEFQGFYFGTNRFWESNLKKMVNPADATEEKFFYEDRVVTGFQGFMTLAPCEAETGEECIKTGPLNEYNNHTYGFSNAWIQLNSSTTTNYIGLQELVNTTTYDYDNDLHKQVTKATTTDSRNKLLETIYEYAHEINNTALLNDNRIALPLKVTKKEDNVVISTRNTIYTDFGGLILPQLFQASFGSDPLEDKLQIISYDANGNVEELIGSDGKTTSIIWAYNGKLPVLKAEGARLDEITTALGDTITFGADNGNTFSASQHADLREIGGALVTVYAYDPGIGMTSQIDPNGRIITYTYDNFNRLVNIKDHDGNILRTFEYHVKTEQQ